MTTSQQPIGSGFGARTTADEVLAGLDLTGRTALVTGGYSGIGLETTRALAKAGAHVVVPARRPDSAREQLAGIDGSEVDELDLGDLDSVKAFAGQVLTTLAAWEDPEFCRDKLGLDAPLGAIDRSKLNVKGSSLAAAHPFAATGGRIVANLAKLLHEKGSGRGLISICAAGGQGVVAILEA